MAELKKPFHEVVAERLIEQLKAGTAPWQRPWDAGDPGAYMPMNPTTGKRYKGINAINLMAQGRNDSRWLTYKQAAAVGAQVRKGEKGTPVQYWKFSEEQDKLDDNGRPVKDAQGEPVKVTVMLERPRVFFATVFNGEQVDGLPPIQRKEQTWDAIERAENIIAASGAVIHHDGGARAFYRPSTDDIHLPDRGQFPSAANYYGVKLHELGHWTGHGSRLDRDLAHPFGSEEYAKEELRAEIASMIIGDELGIGHDPEQHAAYVGSWIKALEDDPLEIFRASADAEKIHDFVLAFEQKQVQEQTQEASQNLTKVHAVSDPLAVDIAEVLTGPDVTFDHFEAFQGATLDHALRSRGLTTVESVTGTDPARFYDEAHNRLSEVFGISPDYTQTDNAYLERKGLAQAFAAKAETIIQDLKNTDKRPPHEMTKAEFASQANAEALTNHGRKWNVILGDRYAAFSDADSPAAAVADVHHAAVNNALFINTPGANGAGIKSTLPPPAVLAEYPDLVAQYPQALQTEAKMQTPSRSSDPFSDDNFAAQVGVKRTPPNAAEGLILSHVERGTLSATIETASLEQVDRVLGVLDSMQPLNTQNAFWGRHELPLDADALNDKIDRAIDETLLQRADAVVAAALLDVKTGNTNSRERDRAAFDTAADNALGFALPHDWTGEVRIVGVIERDGQLEAADLATETPQAFHLYARKGDAMPGDDAFAFLTATTTLEDANTLTDRLAVIDANSELNESVRAAKLARVQEDRVRRDPDSTSEQISAAKEARLTADAVVFASTSDLDQKLDEQERAAWAEQAHELGDKAAPYRADDPASRDAARTAEMPAKQLAQGNIATENTWLDVPFVQKEAAKQAGGKLDDGKWAIEFNKPEKRWFARPGADLDKLQNWIPGQQPSQQEPQTPARLATEKTQLVVPYEVRETVKSLAGKLPNGRSAITFDKAEKKWYALPGANLDVLRPWLPENAQGQQAPAMTPREEFAEAMRNAGLLVPDGHPIMDGLPQRVPVEGGKPGRADGFYVGHLDGKPNGRIVNNRSGGEVIKWEYKGYVSSGEKTADFNAIAAAKLAARDAEQAKAHEATAQRVERQAEHLLPIAEPTAYLKAKGIQPHAGALTDKDGKTTYIPAYDASGKHWTTQYIQEDGTKRFAKNGRKDGCFHPLGGMDALASAPVLVIAEGYATAGTIADELGHATVAAFDSGNLPAVAKALHEKFPDKPVIIAGDDDRHQIITQGTNPGRTKAEAAAMAVGGTAIFPIFAPGENAYPAELPPVTPQTFREHERAVFRLEAATNDPDTVRLSEQERADLKNSLLSSEQLAAIDGMKAHTDFNDLATRSELGREGVARQVGAAVSQALTAKEQEQERKQEQAQKLEEPQEQKPRRAMRV